jgi:hypothetical protein
MFLVTSFLLHFIIVGFMIYALVVAMRAMCCTKDRPESVISVDATTDLSTSSQITDLATLPIPPQLSVSRSNNRSGYLAQSPMYPTSPAYQQNTSQSVAHAQQPQNMQQQQPVIIG